MDPLKLGFRFIWPSPANMAGDALTMEAHGHFEVCLIAFLVVG